MADPFELNVALTRPGRSAALAKLGLMAAIFGAVLAIYAWSMPFVASSTPRPAQDWDECTADQIGCVEWLHIGLPTPDQLHSLRLTQASDRPMIEYCSDPSPTIDVFCTEVAQKFGRSRLVPLSAAATTLDEVKAQDLWVEWLMEERTWELLPALVPVGDAHKSAEEVVRSLHISNALDCDVEMSPLCIKLLSTPPDLEWARQRADSERAGLLAYGHRQVDKHFYSQRASLATRQQFWDEKAEIRAGINRVRWWQRAILTAFAGGIPLLFFIAAATIRPRRLTVGPHFLNADGRRIDIGKVRSVELEESGTVILLRDGEEINLPPVQPPFDRPRVRRAIEQLHRNSDGDSEGHEQQMRDALKDVYDNE